MKTILIVEDHPDIRDNLIELLELSDYKVSSACNGADGLELATAILPDIILCDIMMPVMNGYDLLRKLRADPATAAIPFVYVTAKAEIKEAEAAMQMGAHAYIRKPFTTEELLSTIGRIIGR